MLRTYGGVVAEGEGETGWLRRDNTWGDTDTTPRRRDESAVLPVHRRESPSNDSP